MTIFRQILNRTGIVYDALKKNVLFAEDINAITQAINNLEQNGSGQPGPQGPIGQTGPQGPAGVDGATGATGATGVSTLPLIPKFLNAYYMNADYISGLSNITSVNNTITISPHVSRINHTITGLAINVAAAVAGSAIKLCAYRSDINGNPSTLIFESAEILTATTGIKTITLSQSFNVELGELIYFGYKSLLAPVLTSLSAFNMLNLSGSATFSLTQNKSFRRTLPYTTISPALFNPLISELSSAVIPLIGYK